MGRNKSAVEVNKFVAGLITEASPLTFPDNASLDEDNFVLNRDGSRSRRKGFDLELGSTIIDSGNASPTTGDLARSSFKWSNAGGVPTNTIVVVQIGQNLNFFDSNFETLSQGAAFTYTYPGSLATQRFSYASVDGMLVVATGQKEVDVYIYDTTNNTITKTSKTLFVRDQFGVQDVAVNH